jgi:hypothetical protein
VVCEVLRTFYKKLKYDLTIGSQLRANVTAHVALMSLTKIKMMQFVSIVFAKTLVVKPLFSKTLNVKQALRSNLTSLTHPVHPSKQASKQVVAGKQGQPSKHTTTIKSKQEQA